MLLLSPLLCKLHWTVNTTQIGFENRLVAAVIALLRCSASKISNSLKKNISKFLVYQS